MAKKVSARRVVSLGNIPHDEIDHATALAVMAGGQDVSKGESEEGMSIERLLTEVSAFFENLRISISDIYRRINRWMQRGWVELLDNGHVMPTRRGKPYIELLANAA